MPSGQIAFSFFLLLFSSGGAFVPFHKATSSSLFSATQEAPFNVVSPSRANELTHSIGEALWKMKVLQEDPGFLPTRPQSLQKLFQKCKDSVHVARSSITSAGDGLFASRCISAGEIFSFYPVHTLGVNFRDGTTYLHGHDNYEDSVYVMSLIGNRPILGLSHSIPIIL